MNFFVNMHVKLFSSEAFFSPKCSKYRSAAGLRTDPLGELTATPQTPIARLKGPTSKRGEERKERSGKSTGTGGRKISPCLGISSSYATDHNLYH